MIDWWGCGKIILLTYLVSSKLYTQRAICWKIDIIKDSVGQWEQQKWEPDDEH